MPKTSVQRTRQDILENETSDHLAQQFQFTLEKDGKQSAVNIATWNLLGQCTKKDQKIVKGENSTTLPFANNPWNYKEESESYYKKNKINQETGRKAAQKNKITELAKGNDVICLQEANGYDKGYLDEICRIMGEGWKFIKVAGKEGSESDGFETGKKGKSKQLVILYNNEKCELESKNKTLLNVELNGELRCGLELIFEDKKNGGKFAIHNVHVPQDKDLVDEYYAEETVKDRPFPTITVGDMNNHVSKYRNKKSYHAISCEEATNFDAQIIEGSYKTDDSYQVTQDKCYDMALLRLPSGYSAKCTVQGRFFKADLSSEEVTKTFENIKPNLELQSDSQAEKSKSEKAPPIDSSSDVNRKDYKVTLNQETLSKIKLYLTKIKEHKEELSKILGGRLLNEITNKAKGKGEKIEDCLKSLNEDDFLNLLLNTKKPKSFAEQATIHTLTKIKTEISDAKKEPGWNIDEVDILENIAICVPVTIYDDGGHKGQQVHKEPFQGELLYIPGPVFKGEAAPNLKSYKEIVSNGKFQEDKFVKIMKERLMPVFLHANEAATADNPAFITIPGISCGLFGGKFSNSGSKEIPKALNKAIKELLSENHSSLSNIACVHLDTYAQGSLGEDEDLAGKKFGNITYRTQELEKNTSGDGKNRRQQLDHPKNFDKKFSRCKLFSVVAADALSWPGNDMNIGSRETDEGVKTGATNAMSVMTGIQGEYKPKKKSGEYELKDGETAKIVIDCKGIRIETGGRVEILDARSNAKETKKENHSTASSTKQEKAGNETPLEDDQKLKTAAHKKDQDFESADQAKNQEDEVKKLKETKKENHSAETSNKSPDGSKKQEKTVKKIPLKVEQKTKTTTGDQKLRTDLHKKDQGSKSSDQAKEQEGEVKNLTDLKKYFKVSELKTPTTDRSDTFKNTFSDVKSAAKELEDKYGTSGIEGTKRLLEMELTEKEKVFKNKLTRALNKLASACERKKENAGNLETWEKLTTLDKRVLVDYYNSNLAEGERKIEFKSLYEKTAENGELKIQDQNYALSDFGKKKVTEITSRVYELAIPKTSTKSLFAEKLKNGDRQQYR